VLSREFLIALFSSFQGLRNLTWNGCPEDPQNSDLYQGCIQWNFHLQSLRTKSGLLFAFPTPVLTDRHVLAIDLDASGDTFSPILESYRVHLPHLTELTLNGSWVGLVQVEAPNLRHLDLVGYSGNHRYLAQTTLDPLFLKIFDDGTGQIMEALLAREPWPKVVELLIHLEAHWACGNGRLARLFSADIVTAKFPQIKTLLIQIGGRWMQKGGELRVMTQEQVEAETLPTFGDRPYTVLVL
ncbi:hypothetical protein FRC17_001061, partial [Serendipita sp. 399]